MRLRNWLALGLVVLGTALSVQAGERVLMVATNVAEFNGKPNGTFLMEIAIPFDRLRRAGFQVDVLTPKGGEAAWYKSGREPAGVPAIEADPAFQAAMGNSLSPAQAKATDYAAVLYPGGYAQFTDVLPNAEIAALVSAIHGRGGILGGVGHGTAMFVKLTAPDGRPLVAGKRMTAFPWWTEQGYMPQSGYGAALPFNMETELAGLGARFQGVPVGDREALSLVVDEANRVVTGPYAFNADVVADAMIRLLAQRRQGGPS